MRAGLSEVFEERFDVVLFSFNGIDNLNPVDRRTALDEMRRVLKSTGLLLFSSHSLTTLPFRPHRPGLRPGSWRAFLPSVMRAVRGNRSVDLDAAGARAGQQSVTARTTGRPDSCTCSPNGRSQSWRTSASMCSRSTPRTGGRWMLRDPGRGPWMHYLCGVAGVDRRHDLRRWLASARCVLRRPPNSRSSPAAGSRPFGTSGSRLPTPRAPVRTSRSTGSAPGRGSIGRAGWAWYAFAVERTHLPLG